MWSFCILTLASEFPTILFKKYADAYLNVGEFRKTSS